MEIGLIGVLNSVGGLLSFLLAFASLSFVVISIWHYERRSGFQREGNAR